MHIFTDWGPLLVGSLERQNNCKINSFKKASITLALPIRAMAFLMLENQRNQKPQNKEKWWCNTSSGWNAWKLPEESPYIKGNVKTLKNLESPGNNSNRCTQRGRVKPAHIAWLHPSLSPLCLYPSLSYDSIHSQSKSIPSQNVSYARR